MSLLLTPDLVVAAFQKKGYHLFQDGDYDLNIFGVRYLDNLDLFTDIRGILYKINGEWILHQCPCTTKPGLFALKHPENPNGCSTLKEGQYQSNWEIGFHKGIQETSHRALVQKPTSLPVYRDIEKDGIIRYDALHLKDDGLGINLHGVYNCPDTYTYPNVYNWSEACQVIARPCDQQSFMDLCDQASKIYGNNFGYTLFSINDFIIPPI